MSEHIIYHIADGIATLTLNRPKVLNAINYDLLKELDELLDQAAADDSLRVLILTGSGKAFAAGADIAQQAGMDQEEAAKWGRYGSGIFRRLECFPIPTLAVVNGYALGGGCEMAMAWRSDPGRRKSEVRSARNRAWDHPGIFRDAKAASQSRRQQSEGAHLHRTHDRCAGSFADRTC